MQKASSQDMDWMLQAMLRMYGRDEEAPADGTDEIRMFHGQGFCMELMEGFEETGEDMAGSVFLSGYRPEKLLICPGKHAGFTFQTLSTEEISENEHMENLREDLRRILMRLDRKNVFYEEGQVSGSLPVLWFDYKSFAADERVYNLMFLFQAGERLLLGTFFCVFRDYDRWKPEVLRVLKTVREESGYEV